METIRTRCPSCHKLYSVDPHLIKSSQPQFECLGCRTQFFFEFPFAQTLEDVPAPVVTQDITTASTDVSPITVSPSEVAPDFTSRLPEIGLDQDFIEPIADIPAEPLRAQDPEPAHAPEQTVVGKSCPKCHRMNLVESQECAGCGVIFKKVRSWRSAGETWLETSQQISEAWKAVLSNYDDPAQHAEFLQKCLASGELAVAAKHYRRILDVTPDDERARHMTARIQELAAVQLPVPQAKIVWPSWRTGFFTLVILVGVLLAVTGFTVPWARNLIGVGVSLVMTAIGARIYVRYLM